MNQLSVELIRSHVKRGQIGPMAQNLGMHRNTLSLKLRGEVALRLDEINAIAGYLGIGVDKFLKIEQTPQPDFWQQTDQSYADLRSNTDTWAEELE